MPEHKKLRQMVKPPAVQQEPNQVPVPAPPADIPAPAVEVERPAPPVIAPAAIPAPAVAVERSAPPVIARVDEEISDDEPPLKIPKTSDVKDVKGAWRELVESLRTVVLREDLPSVVAALASLQRMAVPFTQETVVAAFPHLKASAPRATPDDDDADVYTAALVAGFPPLKRMYRSTTEACAIPEVHGIAVNILLTGAPELATVARALARFHWVVTQRKQRSGFVTNTQAGIPATIAIWESLLRTFESRPLSPEQPYPHQWEFTRALSLWRVTRLLFDIPVRDWPLMLIPFMELLSNALIKAAVASKSEGLIELTQWKLLWHRRDPPRPPGPKDDLSTLRTSDTPSDPKPQENLSSTSIGNLPFRPPPGRRGTFRGGPSARSRWSGGRGNRW